MSVLGSIKNKFTLITHKGDNFHCPFCGYKAKDMYEIGIDIPVLREKKVVGGGLRKGGCYKCHSYDRERLIYFYLIHELKIQDNSAIKSILHIAPERHVMEELLKIPFLKYACGDKFTQGYSYPTNVADMDLTSLKFENNTFDFVISNHVLEHIPNDLDAMKEIFRVLKSGGQAILQVPFSLNTEKTLEDWTVTDPTQREKVFGQFDHLRIYGQDYLERLRSVGFKVSSINISGKYKLAGLNPDEDLFIINKP